jgi:threonine/homoserine/homoserine lactone efflux protein
VLGLFAIFGGVSTFVEVKSTIDVLLMVAAIMTGSLLWWIALSNLISHYRHLIDAERLRAINRIAGILLAGLGGLLLFEVFLKRGNF